MERRAYEQRHQQPQHPRNRFPSDRKGSRATCNDKENRKDHKIHFSETSKETMSDKIKRLILNDSEKSS